MYFFKGVVSANRTWLTKYPDVVESGYGRDANVKYQLDIDYYKGLSSSLFGLAPIGDCPWSYRFFESIMCKAIPILGDTDQDIFSDGYYFLRDSGDHKYDSEAAERNLTKMIKNHTLPLVT